MNTVLVAGCGALVAGGLFVLVLGLLRLVRSPRSPRRRPAPWRDWRRSTWLRVGVAAVSAVIGFGLTGWVVMLVAAPAAVLGVPWLLSAPPNRELDLLSALERWVRTLATSMPTGKSISDAVRATRRQVPDLLLEPVATTVMRMDGRWSTHDALLAMADELDSASADACLAALALASQRGGTGATATLSSLAESMQARLKALREIEAERAKPRVVVRQVTVITVVVIGAALLAGGAFFEPYSSVMGQVILATLLMVYVGSLLVLRRRTISQPRERILVQAAP